MRTVAVIGGGAAGMMAAIEAASCGACVHLFERQARVGKKLSVTGNGRCNLSNTGLSPERYHGEDRAFVLPALRFCGTGETLRRFREMGLLTVTEPGGRIYPLSDTAGSVVDVLRFSLDAAGVQLHAGCEVSEVKRTKGGFWIAAGETGIKAEKLIIACGGAAGEKVGGTNLGYRLLECFGHSVTPLRPSLVQLRTGDTLCRSLKGVRADARVTVLRGGKTVAETAGEVQFVEYGLSGPAIFEVSRAALEENGTVVELDLLRGYAESELLQLLQERCAARPQLNCDDLFTGTVHNRLGRVLLKVAGVSGTAPISELTEKELRRLSHACKAFRFEVTGDMGLPNAQVTAGGVRTGEFFPETMESRLCPGLYACGEVLDVDGDCGGFNLQWAWASGALAGRSAAEA